MSTPNFRWVRSLGMQRVRVPELMDAPDADRGELSRALGFIRWVNHSMGGSAALIRWLDLWSKGWPTGKPMTLLDVATGSADVPIAARVWARKRGLDLRITAIDLHPTTLDLAREYLSASDPKLAEGVELVAADALEMVDRFGIANFDVAHAGLFLHHLSEINAMNVLRQMDRVSRVGLVWNDLVRSRAGFAAIHAMTIGAPEMVRHDARVSVRAGFTKREALDIAHRVGLHDPTYRWNLLHHRFTVSSFKGDL